MSEEDKERFNTKEGRKLIKDYKYYRSQQEGNAAPPIEPLKDSIKRKLEEKSDLRKKLGASGFKDALDTVMTNEELADRIATDIWKHVELT